MGYILDENGAIILDENGNPILDGLTTIAPTTIFHTTLAPTTTLTTPAPTTAGPTTLAPTTLAPSTSIPTTTITTSPPTTHIPTSAPTTIHHTTVVPTTLAPTPPPTTTITSPPPNTIIVTTDVPTTPVPIPDPPPLPINLINWKGIKGSGPWVFSPQPNKWGYLNNPRWMSPPGAPVNYDGREDEEPQVWDLNAGAIKGGVKHDPCGHWHKVVVGGGPITTLVPTTDISIEVLLVPLVIINNFDEVQVFEDVLLAPPTEVVPYPATGTDIADTYIPYGVITPSFELASLTPIAATGYYIDCQSIANIDDYTFDTVPSGPPPWDSGVYNICGGHTFYIGMLGPEHGLVYYPSDYTYVDTINQEYDEDTGFRIRDPGNAVVDTPTGLPSDYSYYLHQDSEVTTIHANTITPYWTVEDEWSLTDYYYIDSIGWFADCLDNSDVTVVVNADVETGSRLHHKVIASAVVVNVPGYTDYKTWGCIYADLVLNTANATVYLALCDEVNGFRQYKLEDVDYLGYYSTIADVIGTAKVDIFDYNGKPYFVCSYVGIQVAGPM